MEDQLPTQSLTQTQENTYKNNNSPTKTIIKSIKITKIPLEPTEKSNNKLYFGSLYNLTTSEYFNIDMLISYLYSRQEQGIQDTLVNIMSMKYIDKSYFYIPQLCMMLMLSNKTYSESIETYILDRCIDRLKFSVKTFWMINSFIPKDVSASVSVSIDQRNVAKLFEKMLSKIEMTLINGRRSTSSGYKYHQYHNNINESTVEVRNLLETSKKKEEKLNYFDNVIRFYYDIKKMCEKLFSFPRNSKENERIDNRSSVLKAFIKDFNYRIENLKENNRNYRGFILPFDDYYSISDEYNSIIVSIIPEYCMCFSSKGRVPVKITVETIKMKEVDEWELKYIKDVGEYIKKREVKEFLSVEDFLNQNEGVEVDVVIDFDEDEREEREGKDQCRINKSEVLTHEQIWHKDKDVNVDVNVDVDVERNEFQLLEYNTENNNNNNKKNIENTIEINKIINEINQSNQSTFQTESLQKQTSHISNFKKTLLYDYDDKDLINPFDSLWVEDCEKIKKSSQFQKFSTYSIKTFIAKSNDDLRQELLVIQIIKRFDDIFKSADIPLRLKPYEILITSSNSGLIEYLPDTISIDSLKKKLPSDWNLNVFYRFFFKHKFEEAQKNFCESLAAYSLVCYFLELKDRHNGNILIDINGNIIHIDFGFILGISPGDMNFEGCPFKFTVEYAEVLDGIGSGMITYFKALMLRGVIELKKHYESIVRLVEIMSYSKEFNCFRVGERQVIIDRLRQKFLLNKNDFELQVFVNKLVEDCFDNWRTNYYDKYQFMTNGIYV